MTETMFVKFMETFKARENDYDKWLDTVEERFGDSICSEICANDGLNTVFIIFKDIFNDNADIIRDAFFSESGVDWAGIYKRITG